VKSIHLPSGAVLKLGHTPFEESYALNEAFLKELKKIKFDSETEMSVVFKDVFCVGFSSPKIKKALWTCFKRCIYSSEKGDLKIDKDTFEPVEAREDYITVCMEVAKHNIGPFVKTHFSELSQVLDKLKASPEPKSKTTP